MKNNKRKRLLIDPKLQGAILYRVLLYWAVCVLVMGLLAGLQVSFTGREVEWPVLLRRILFAFGPALIAAVLILPVLVVETLRFSLRFAGPMHRLRTVIDKIADGQWDGPVNFRKGDYWHDLAQGIDRIGNELSELRAEKASKSESEIDAAAAE